jgi:glycosyltransferase involved in cell wall biosynthesis
VIISTKCGCAPDLVEEKMTGWVFEPGEKGDLKIRELLQKILDDRSILDSMGERAWQKLQPFSYRVAIDKIKRLMERITLAENKKVKKPSPDGFNQK